MKSHKNDYEDGWGKTSVTIFTLHVEEKNTFLTFLNRNSLI